MDTQFSKTVLMRRAKVALKSDLDTTDPEVLKGRWRNAWFRTDASEIPLPDST